MCISIDEGMAELKDRHVAPFGVMALTGQVFARALDIGHNVGQGQAMLSTFRIS